MKRHAAAGVAAHFGFASIRINDLHTYVRFVGRQQQNKPVRAHAKTAVAYFWGQRARVFYVRSALPVQHDKVVAESGIFGKLHTFIL